MSTVIMIICVCLQILDTLDEHHAEQAVVFLPVLYQLTVAVNRWFPTQVRGGVGGHQYQVVRYLHRPANYYVLSVVYYAQLKLTMVRQK